MIHAFETISVPRLRFGAGRLLELPGVVASFGDSCLLVTGSRSLEQSGKQQTVFEGLHASGIRTQHVRVDGEPTLEFIDAVVCESRQGAGPPEVVVGIGGGSVLDAAKAIAALLLSGDGVEPHLEVPGGGAPLRGAMTPLIAVPTTAGTGSEATMNAVLGRPGSDGYKASLRDPRLVPDVALVDPELLIATPRGVRVACAFDALTQLLESFVSKKASPMTDMTARAGLQAMGRALPRAFEDSVLPLEVAADLAFGAFQSGVALANAGLGIVHGIAPILGARFEVPHGTACAMLLAVATRQNLRTMHSEEDYSGLHKYAEASRALLRSGRSRDEDAVELLLNRLDAWTEDAGIEWLSDYGVSRGDAEWVARAAKPKNNPASLAREDVESILEGRMG